MKHLRDEYNKIEDFSAAEFRRVYPGERFSEDTPCRVFPVVPQTCSGAAMTDCYGGRCARQIARFDAQYPVGGLFGPVLLTECGKMTPEAQP